MSDSEEGRVLLTRRELFGSHLLAGTSYILLHGTAVASHKKTISVSKERASELEEKTGQLLGNVRDLEKHLGEARKTIQAYEDSIRAFQVTTRMAEVIEEPLRLVDYQPLIREKKQRGAFLEAIIDQCHRFREEGLVETKGYDIPPVLACLAIIEQESRLKHLITNGRLTHNTKSLRTYSISDWGAGGPAQALPNVALKWGLERVVHPENYNRIWETVELFWKTRDEAEQARNSLARNMYKQSDLKRNSVQFSRREALDFLRKKDEEKKLWEKIKPELNSYRNTLTSEVAGRTVSELDTIDQRFTLEGTTWFLVNHLGHLFNKYPGLFQHVFARYYSRTHELKRENNNYARRVTGIFLGYIETLNHAKGTRIYVPNIWDSFSETDTEQKRLPTHTQRETGLLPSKVFVL
jgi:hypothetical protein